MHRRNSRICSFAVNSLILLLLAVSGNRLSAETWHKLRTPHFTVLSAARDNVTIEWATELEAYFTDIERYVVVDEQTRPPLTMIILPDGASMQRFQPEGKTPSGDKASYFAQLTTGAYYLVSTASDKNTARRVAYHSGVHWLVGQTRPPIDSWYMEGLAELFSTFSVARNEIVLGKAPENYRDLRTSPLSVRDLLAAAPGSPLYEEYQRQTALYTNAWLLMHLIMVDDNPRFGSAPARYFALLQQNLHRVDAFAQAFGMSCEEMDGRLAEMRKSNKIVILRRTFDRGAIERSIVPAQLEPTDVDFALGQVYGAVGHHSEAAVQLRRVTAALPDDERVQSAFAELEVARNNPQGAREILDRLISDGAKTYLPYLMRAQTIMQSSTTVSHTYQMAPVEARVAADDLTHVLQLASHSYGLYDSLARVVVLATPRRETDYAVLSHATPAGTTESVLTALAFIDEEAGRIDDARQRYEALLKRDINPSTTQHQFIKARLAALQQRDVAKELNDLLAAKDYSKLRDRIDALLAAGDTSVAPEALKTLRQRLDAEEVFDQVAAATDGGNSDEAERLLNSIISSDRFDMGTKNRARMQLTSLKASARLTIPPLKKAADSSD